jgi:exopolysaccharide biosynthesis polyprenyl glycosylphosphotransferase
MTDRTPNHLCIAAVDGAIALNITVLIVMSANHSFASILHANPAQVRFADAGFGVFFIFAWQYCFSVLNLYDKFATIPSKMMAILKGVITMTIPVIAYLILFHPSALKVRVAVLVVTALFSYEIGRVLFSERLLYMLAARNPQRAIILGSGRRAGKAWREIRTHYHSSIKLLGFVDDRETGEMPPDVAARYIGTVDQLNDLLLNEVVDLILVAMPIQSCYQLMQQAITIAERVGVQVIYLQDIYATRRQCNDTNRVIFRELVPQHEHFLLRLAVKRLVDICGALLGLVLFSPLLLCIAIGIKLSSDGPVLFTQERYCYRRRRFRMLKFRSMVHNAEELLSNLESQNEAVGPIFKMRDDPRVTKFGRFLRTTSLDELPQLWNVLTGEMSLVGPRPMSIRDVSKFSEASLMRRFSVTPGMTGLWQINGRSGVEFAQWIEMDFSYIDQWSLLLDVKIMARTITAVLKRSGAM